MFPFIDKHNVMIIDITYENSFSDGIINWRILAISSFISVEL